MGQDPETFAEITERITAWAVNEFGECEFVGDSTIIATVGSELLTVSTIPDEVFGVILMLLAVPATHVPRSAELFEFVATKGRDLVQARLYAQEGEKPDLVDVLLAQNLPARGLTSDEFAQWAWMVVSSAAQLADEIHERFGGVRVLSDSPEIDTGQPEKEQSEPSSSQEPTKVCVDCAAEIKLRARVCRYCGYRY